MTDTSPEIERMQFEMMKGLGSRRRIELACEMYDAARTAVLNSIPAKLSSDARRRAFVEKMYGTEFSDRLFGDTER